jgi:rubrerythrin
MIEIIKEGKMVTQIKLKRAKTKKVRCEFCKSVLRLSGHSLNDDVFQCPICQRKQYVSRFGGKYSTWQLNIPDLPPPGCSPP